ncbi:MAG: cytochrome b/b6 domain-containing protein [Bacteroidetes bacterium]|nr:cytochrome b/b6 domain-containing protein [Bacteroidota bacterium]
METSVTSGFNEKHSAGIRIWHWLFFLLIAAAMITVLLASTTFRTGNNTEMVRQELQKKQLAADKDQARAVAHAFSDKLWELHTYIGYFIAAFLLARLILEFFQPAEEKMRKRMKMARAADAWQQQEMRHYVMVKRGYLLFYLLILIMAVTGLALAFEEVPLFREMRKGIKQVHSLTQYGIYAFALFHLVGVVMADAGEHPGLVSGMIHGKRRN